MPMADEKWFKLGLLKRDLPRLKSWMYDNGDDDGAQLNAGWGPHSLI